VSAETAGGSRSSGKMIVIVVLAIIAILAIIAGIMYFVEPAKSLPSVLGTITHPLSRANAHRPTRGAVALAVGVICLVAAWLVSRLGRARRR
jgi:flagellar biogenesis protein FliO